jgi:hypothetical protein
VQRNEPNHLAITRLTALWALTESAVGGWMHALHLPLTGIFVGGAAVVMIALIARYSHFSYREVLQATLLVMLVKFAASPQSPPQAYVAVGFQGLAGAVLYKLVPNFTIASVLFGVIAMLESALQKLIFMTLIYGRSLWEALDAFFGNIVKSFSLPADIPFSYWLIAGYTWLYAVWGLVLGIWISRLPGRIKARAKAIGRHFRELQLAEESAIQSTTGRRKGRLLPMLLMLGFIAGVFLLSGRAGLGKAEYVIVRTLAALVLLFGIINPLVKLLLKRWLSKSTSKHKESLEEILDLLPELRKQVRPAFRMASTNHTGFRRYSAFLFILIVITLYPIHERTPDLHLHPSGT